jgi:hypothetical protein
VSTFVNSCQLSRSTDLVLDHAEYAAFSNPHEGEMLRPRV